MSRIKEMLPDEMLAGIGHNAPPEPTPFDLSEQEINDLYDEAKHWLDGEPVTTQAQCDAVQKLMRTIQAAEKLADARRVEEVQPHEDAKKEIQARYNPLIGQTTKITGKTKLAIDACKKAMQPYLAAEDARKRAIAEAARALAERRADEARAAMRAAAADDLAARERAEMIARDAKQFEEDAKAAEKDKAVSRGAGRAASLRTVFRAEIVDAREFARWAWVEHRSEVDEFFRELAKYLVDGGKRGIPGVTVHEEKVVV